MRNIVLVMVLSIVVPLGAEERVHRTDQVRIWYHTDGVHAVEPADSNANGVPDVIEDIMTQVLAARSMFVEVLGFPDPLKTERFKTASFIDIHLRSKDVLKMNGVAFDELQRYRKQGDPEGTLSIGFNVATTVRAPANLTPAHEFFHLIQYSTTYFKNRWFLEGTARWSERALGEGDLGLAKIMPVWPLPSDQRSELFGMAYEASEHLWNPLAKRLDVDGEIPNGLALQRLKNMKYIDGSPVLKDLRLRGWKFVRDVLQELAKMDDIAFSDLGYDRWSEDNQRSPKNDEPMLRAVEAVVGRQ